MFTVEDEIVIDTQERCWRGPRTSIAVAATLYNYSQFIVGTLDDVADQTHEFIELVIVDDCSTDSSAEVARAWIESNRARFVAARLVRHRMNYGLAQSRNTAFSRARSEHVFVLDADNSIYPRAIARLFEAMEVSGQAGAYCQLEKFGDEAGVGVGDVWDPEHFRRGNYIDAMALVKRSAWATVGGYSHMDVVGWEDYDFWCKFVGAGLRCVYVPEMLCRYRVHAKSMLRTESNPRIERLQQEMILRHPSLAFAFN